MTEPRSPLFRYAFGYSNEKPHWSFWVAVALMVVFILCNSITISPAHAKAPSREAAAANCLSKADVWKRWGQEAHPKYRLTEEGKCWYAAGEPLPARVVKKKPVRFARVISSTTVIAAPVVEAPLEPRAVRTIPFKMVPAFEPLSFMTPAEIVRFRWWK